MAEGGSGRAAFRQPTATDAARVWLSGVARARGGANRRRRRRRLPAVPVRPCPSLPPRRPCRGGGGGRGGGSGRLRRGWRLPCWLTALRSWMGVSGAS